MKQKYLWGHFALCGMLLAILKPTRCQADGILIKDQDTAATARGDAFTATADNPSAIYYNPAGITQLPGHQYRAGLYTLTYRTRLRSLTGTETESKRAFAPIPNFYYTYSPPQYPVSFGIGMYAPFGLSMKWPEDSGFRSLALEGSVKYFTLAPVVAWRVHPTFSVAAGPTLNFGQAVLKQGLSSFAANDSFQFNGNAFAPGFNLGARWQPVKQLAFGLVYRSATTMDFDGHSDTASVTPSFSLRQDAQAKFEFPQHLTAGVSWRPTTNWNFEFDADWTDWSSFSAVPIRQATPVPTIVLNWNSSWFFSWGVTRQFANGWRASAGYIFSENSVPDAHFTPLVPDTERHTFSIGLGKQGERWSWDVAYQLTYGVPRVVSGSALSPAGQSADGHYETIANALSVSVGRKF